MICIECKDEISKVNDGYCASVSESREKIFLCCNSRASPRILALSGSFPLSQKGFIQQSILIMYRCVGDVCILCRYITFSVR